MLEQVSVGQNRFNVPGIATDSRGVCLGRFVALHFASIDRVVAFFSAFTAENSMDDLQSGMRIVQVETPLKTRELIVLLPARSSHIADMAARMARVVGGSAFTGTSKHFVLYRDDRSPLGYDASELLREDADFALYGSGFTQTYKVTQELEFSTLIKRLSIVAERPRRRDDQDDEAVPAPTALLLAAQPGLASAVRGYLWRSGVRASMAIVSRAGASTFSDAPSEYFLFQLFEAPPRIVRLFRDMPGVRLFVPYSPSLAVKLGFRHPFTLENCTSAFASDRLAMFDEKGLEETTSHAQFVPIERLGSSTFDVAGPDPTVSEARAPSESETAEEFALQLRLAPAGGSARRVRATLVPRSQHAWLKKIVYTLPSALLQRYQVAVTNEYVILLNAEGVDSMPLGSYMEAFAQNIFVPMGFRFVPAVSAEVLASHIKARPENYYFFVGGRSAPFFVGAERFVTLERRALAPIVPEEVGVQDVPGAGGIPSLVNDPVGRFSLWFNRLGDAPEPLMDIDDLPDTASLDDTIDDTMDDPGPPEAA